MHSEAIRLESGIVDELCARYGETSIATLKARIRLSRIYSAAGKHGESIRLSEEIYRLSEDSLGVGYSVTLECLEHLAEAYRDAGGLDTAIGYYEDLLRLRRDHLGPSHIATLDTEVSLGIAYVMKGERADLLSATRIFEEALKAVEDALGAYELKTVKTRYLIANCYSLRGNNARAIKLMRAVVDIMKEHYRPDHIHTMRYLHYLGCYCYLRYQEMQKDGRSYSREDMLSMLSSAEQYMMEARAICSRAYADDAPISMRIKGDIESVQSEKRGIT